MDDRLSPSGQQGRKQGQQQHERNQANSAQQTYTSYTDSTFLAELEEPMLGGRRLGRVGVFPPRRRRRRFSLCQHSEKVHAVLAVNSSHGGVRFPCNSPPASFSYVAHLVRTSMIQHQWQHLQAAYVRNNLRRRESSRHLSG